MYDVVDQEEYSKRVESRRQMDDFVVDDGKPVYVRRVMPHVMKYNDRGPWLCRQRRGMDRSC